jgi:hemoglobin
LRETRFLKINIGQGAAFGRGDLLLTPVCSSRIAGGRRKGEPMQIASSMNAERFEAELRFVAAVALRFDTPLAIGETADGVRFDFTVHGTVVGPELNGKFPRCAAYLLIDRDGIGTINVRAPLLLNDGAVAELEAIGRYDFGEDGYQRAVALDLPNSALGWCPRFLTGDPRYLWLNRVLCVGVGELRPRETRVDYDLFVMSPRPASGTRLDTRATLVAFKPKPKAPQSSRPLYERLGGPEKIHGFMGAFVDRLHSNTELHRQNSRVAAAILHVDEAALKRKVGDFVCKLAGGPCEYQGRPMRASHARLGITEANWALGAQELMMALEEYRVSAEDGQELLALIGQLKPDIVTKA